MKRARRSPTTSRRPPTRRRSSTTRRTASAVLRSVPQFLSEGLLYLDLAAGRSELSPSSAANTREPTAIRDRLAGPPSPAAPGEHVVARHRSQRGQARAARRGGARGGRRQRRPRSSHIVRSRRSCSPSRSSRPRAARRARSLIDGAHVPGNLEFTCRRWCNFYVGNATTPVQAAASACCGRPTRKVPLPAAIDGAPPNAGTPFEVAYVPGLRRLTRYISACGARVARVARRGAGAVHARPRDAGVRAPVQAVGTRALARRAGQHV